MAPLAEARSEPLVLRWLGRAIDTVLIVAGAAIVLLMFGNVTSRFVFNFDVAWSMELINFLMMWATFLGAAAAAQRGAHMRVMELILLTHGRVRIAVELAIAAVTVLTLVTLIRFGWTVAMGNMDQLSTVLYWPVGLQYLALPVGAALTLVYVLRDVVRLFAGRSVPTTSTEV